MRLAAAGAVLLFSLRKEGRRKRGVSGLLLGDRGPFPSRSGGRTAVRLAAVPSRSAPLCDGFVSYPPGSPSEISKLKAK